MLQVNHIADSVSIYLCIRTLALRDWTTVHGVGPFYYFRDTPVSDYRYKGRSEEPPVVSIAFGYSGDFQIEIIHQQNAAASCYRDFLASGREGLHHISGFTDRAGYDERYARAVACGLPSMHEGSIGGVRFAYFPTERGPGTPLCEISESEMDGPRQLFDRMQEAAAGWDGTDPVRPLADLVRPD
jgi:hypothetical protein